MAKKILGLPLKPKAANMIPIEEQDKSKPALKPRQWVDNKPPKKEKLPNCKGCDKELRKIKFNSRSEDEFYVHVCNHAECNLYRHFQGHEGDIPEGLKLVEI